MRSRRRWRSSRRTWRDELQAGKAAIHRCKNQILKSYKVTSERPTGDKATRAWAAAATAENGLIHLVRSRHSQAFLDELTAFPHGKHDDCIDALSGAHTALAKTGGTASIASPANHQINLPTPGRSYAEQRYTHHNDTHLEAIANRIGATIWPAPPGNIVTSK